MTMEPVASTAREVLTRPDFLLPPVAPRDEVETTLIAIWERILDFAPVGIDDDFFQLDGDSFMAVTLFTEIEDQWARKIPPSSLIQSPTIRALAKLIQEPGPASSHPAVVVFNDAGVRPPLYFIHGRGGEVLFARPIADALDAEQPFFALRYARGQETWPRPATIEGIAAAYARLLRSRHGDGPFRLAGYSLGAVLALETARHLKAEGGINDCLIMVDPPVSPRTRRQRLSHHARDLLGQSPNKAVVLLTHRLRDYLGRPIRNLARRFPDVVRGGSGGATDRALRQQRLELGRAFRAFRPLSYDGPVTIFSSADSLRVYQDPTLGWDDTLTGPIETIEMPGTHTTIVTEPIVRELATRFAACLRADSKS
jgi:thioesterase domain-containing protein/acyl carrier protein